MQSDEQIRQRRGRRIVSDVCDWSRVEYELENITLKRVTLRHGSRPFRSFVP
jgi:hypothetical protein